MKHSHVNCPQCGHEFEVEAAMTSKIRDKIHKEMLDQKREQEAIISRRMTDIEKMESHLKERIQKENDIIERKIKEREVSLYNELSKKFESQYKSALEMRDHELKLKMEQVADLKAKELQVVKLQQKLNTVTNEVELEMEKKFLARQKETEERMRKQMAEQSELKLKEKDKQLEEQRVLIAEMKRKADLGSTKLQGQVQEMAIEEWLLTQFPLDRVDLVKSGARGADCILEVNTRERQQCGSIYIESKRTKDFQRSWISKFKTDIQQVGADIGIIVTETLPKEMERMGMQSGIWICTFAEFKGLIIALRHQLILMSNLRATQEDRGTKMSLLYNYLTSNEFRMHMEGIVEGFTQLQSDLQREKNAMFRIWNQREKQIEKVLMNTTGMYGSIKGIAGAAVSDLPHLELPESSNEPETSQYLFDLEP